MKKLITYVGLGLGMALSAQAQIQPGFQITPRVGYDISTNYKNNTTYIKYKGGINLGLTTDYFWGAFGVGADFDYIKNQPQSTFPKTNLQNTLHTPLTSFNTSAQSITRTFYGIGPSYQMQAAGSKFNFALNARVGLSNIKGGKLEHRENTTLVKELLNFHAGYNASNALAAKLQLKTTYFPSPNFGLVLGAYYMHHFNVPELVDAGLGVSTAYLPTSTANPAVINGSAIVRADACKHDISSIGAYAGLVFKFGARVKVNLDPAKCKPEYSLVVTAKDKYTGELLPNTQVIIKSDDGLSNLSAITNAFGVAVFEKIKPFAYSIDGSLANTALEGNNAQTAEFSKSRVLQKTILYSDQGFIVQGKIYQCNTSTPIKDIAVVIGNTDLTAMDQTLSKDDGSFLLRIADKDTYSLYGKKGSYLSQVETVTPANYNRQKSLFVKLEICADAVECGKAIALRNILFDLDQYTIKESAKKELNRLVRFMKDNPGVVVEVGSHTDSRSTDVYNNTLSQNRANASVDYIVSQGIDRSRLTARGYGETKLLNPCADGANCSEAEHAINRRTEMKVICPGTK